jgi:hypothetical protein
MTEHGILALPCHAPDFHRKTSLYPILRKAVATPRRNTSGSVGATAVPLGVGMERSGMTWPNGTLNRLLAAKRKQSCYVQQGRTSFF